MTVQKFRTAEDGGAFERHDDLAPRRSAPELRQHLEANRSSRAERGLNDFPGCPFCVRSIASVLSPHSIFAIRSPRIGNLTQRIEKPRERNHGTPQSSGVADQKFPFSCPMTDFSTLPHPPDRCASGDSVRSYGYKYNANMSSRLWIFQTMPWWVFKTHGIRHINDDVVGMKMFAAIYDRIKEGGCGGPGGVWGVGVVPGCLHENDHRLISDHRLIEVGLITPSQIEGEAAS